MAVTSAISSSPMEISDALVGLPPFLFQFARWPSSLRSRSRRLAAFSKSCISIAASFSRRTSRMASSTSLRSGEAHMFWMRLRDAASSIRSTALSGRKRSLM